MYTGLPFEYQALLPLKRTRKWPGFFFFYTNNVAFMVSCPGDDSHDTGYTTIGIIKLGCCLVDGEPWQRAETRVTSRRFLVPVLLRTIMGMKSSSIELP